MLFEIKNQLSDDKSLCEFVDSLVLKEICPEEDESDSADIRCGRLISDLENIEDIFKFYKTLIKKTVCIQNVVNHTALKKEEIHTNADLDFLRT